MKRNTILKFLNPILGLLLLNQILSGFFADFLPHAAFEVLHEGGGVVLGLGILLHLILNWNWVKITYFKRPIKVA